MQRIEFLSKISVFSGLSDSQLTLLASHLREKSYKEGEFIVNDSDIVDAICLLNTGKVKLSKYSPNGREQIEHIYEHGEMMGLCCLFTNIPFPANAVSMENSTVYILPKKKLEELAFQEPSLLLNLVFALSTRLAESMTMVEGLSLKKVNQRVASFLIYTLSQNGAGNRIELAVNQQELARMLGATPESISRTLKDMKKKKIISMEGRTVTIHDLNRLNEIADGE